MLNNNYKTALVTGASSGIGEATVRLLSKNNIQVFAAARRKSRLTKLAKETGCTPIIIDIRNRSSVEKLKKTPFDILVNNAGLGRGFTKIFNTKSKDIDVTIDTNVNAFLQLLRCITPNMVKKKKGHIINIGSIAGIYPLFTSSIILLTISILSQLKPSLPMCPYDADLEYTGFFKSILANFDY